MNAVGRLVPINPTTEEPLGEVREVSGRELDDIIRRAKRESSWKDRSAAERARIVSPLADLLEENKDALARTMAREMGKPLRAGRYEVELATARIRAYCERIPGYVAPETMFEDETETNLVVYEPLGVAAVISPWNAPVFVSIAAIIPALLCGNNVIWKPSEHVPFVSQELARLFDRLAGAGLPKAAFTMILGAKEVGRRLVAGDVDIVSLTGSVGAGKEVVRSSADKLHRFILELGGKDPAIVMEDADIDFAAKSIVASSTMFTGQVCFAVERVYCQAAVYDEFVEKCVDGVARIRVGDPLDDETEMGPFAVRFQMERVLDHVRDAARKNARVLCGCERLGEKGYFMSPGVIVEVNHDMKIMTEETFGPVIPIMKFDDIEEAVRLANDTDYGLTASVWTGDPDRGREIAERIEAGTVEVNRHGMSKLGCPWGGYKQSGIGRMYSKEGIREFTNVKHVWVVKPGTGPR
jgi:acyl-CoA reductase-like NAD-dependent aldehyde dehydrogenase